MRRPDDYTYIAAWGRMMGSYSSYIRSQAELAAEDNAPLDAIYRRDDGTWATTSDVSKASTRQQLGLLPLTPQEPDMARVVPELRRSVLWTELLHDLYGMTQVEQLDQNVLLIRFSTGWSVQLKLELRPPGLS